MRKSLTVASAFLTLLALNCESRSVTLSEKEVECFSQSKIYHPESDKCYKLLTRGPCESGYWFVLEKPKRTATGPYTGVRPTSINAICVQEKCPEGGFYWPKTKTCVQAKEKNILCGNTADEELLNNVFGEAECMCARDPLRARVSGDDNNRCYQLYTRGPCRREEVLGANPGEPGKAACVADACYDEKVKRQREGTLGRDAVLAPWTNGTCYELGTQGPCPDTLKFKVDEVNLEPSCISLTNAIFDLERPQKCHQDENGDCQKKIDAGKAQSAEKYKQELLSSLSSLRKKRQLHRE